MKSDRFLRTEAVLGKENTEKLKKTFAVVVGLGGVGGYALEALARMGVMNFRVVDSDCFEETNLNRQLLSLSGNLGSMKVDVAEERLYSINPEIKVEKMQIFVDSSNIQDVLSDNPTIVLDAIDSVGSKCLLLEECIKRKIPVVSSMGAALKKDPTQVKTATIAKTFGCALAKKVRSEIRNKEALDKIMCVFSPEHAEINRDGTLGSLVTVVGTFGLCLAQLAVNSIISE